MRCRLVIRFTFDRALTLIYVVNITCCPLQLSDELEINAAESGDLDVSVRTDLASVCTYFKDLRLDAASSSSSSAAGSTSTFPSNSSHATVRISAKKLTRFEILFR
jgi:hypothetical protein